jgi:hypothetical protein
MRHDSWVVLQFVVQFSMYGSVVLIILRSSHRLNWGPDTPAKVEPVMDSSKGQWGMRDMASVAAFMRPGR